MDCNQAQISVDQSPERCILRLAGTLGIAHSEELLRLAREVSAGEAPVLIDWTAVSRIDTSVAQVLLTLRANLREGHRPLSVTGVSPDILHWLEGAGLESLVESGL
jgi:anti-anti-sigma regulatory factor